MLISLRALSWLALAVSVLLGVATLVAVNSGSMHYLYSDEWVITKDLVDSHLLDAALTSHNAAPAYIQHMLWKLDYDLLDYTRRLPQIYGLITLIAGVVLLAASLRRAELSAHATAFVMAVLLALWFAFENRTQYNTNLFRIAEASTVLFLIGGAAFALVIYQRRQCLAAGYAGFSWLVLALALGWVGVYIHSGFGVLPAIAGAALLASRSHLTKVGIILVVALFGAHFLAIHSTGAGLPAQWSLGNAGLGFAALLMALPVKLAVHSVGDAAGIVLAVVGTTAGLLYFLLLTWRVLRGTAPAHGLIAWLMIAYAVILAGAIAYHRIVGHDWTEALTWRYANYAIFFLAGVLLAAWGESGRWRPVSGLTVMLVSVIALAGWVSAFDRLPRQWAIVAHARMAMVPYTLPEWHKLPIPRTNDRQYATSRGYRDILKREQRNVFASPGYRVYESLRQSQPVAHSHTQCTGGMRVVPAEHPRSETTAYWELRGSISGPTSGGSAPAAIFTALDGEVLGWAPRATRWPLPYGRWDQGEWQESHYWGGVVTTQAEQHVRASLATESGQILCSTEPMRLRR